LNGYCAKRPSRGNCYGAPGATTTAFTTGSASATGAADRAATISSISTYTAITPVRSQRDTICLSGVVKSDASA
jgi:hypothetical protein